jgi:hypothetical protein
VAVTAGAVRHPLSSFSPYDAIAAASWATYAALVGFLGGAAFDGEPVKGVLSGLGLALSVAGAIELVRHLRRRGQRVIAEPDRVSSTAADHGYRGRGPGSSRVRRQAHDLRLDVSAEARCGSRLPNGGF